MSESTIEFGSDGKNSVRTTLVGSLAKFNYTTLPYSVIALNGDTLYGTDSGKTKLYKSTDNGITWSGLLWIIPTTYNITIAHLTDSGAILWALTLIDIKVSVFSCLLCRF